MAGVSGLGWVAFVVAAAAGAPARYVVDTWVHERTAGRFPWGTFVVNVSGCFALGIVAGLGRYDDLAPGVATVLGSGALGAYTTFSTLAFETVQLAEDGELGTAAANVAANLAAGLLAAAAGLAIVAAAVA